LESWIDISDDELSVDEVHSFLYKSQGGGVCVFSGTTRRDTKGVLTKELHYEANKGMALREMRRLASEAESTWPILRLVMLHRTGTVRVGEASVIIGVATDHRGPSFDAVRFLIDELKKTVQIWKKEHFEDGSTEWVATDWQDTP
jgi:molybdopterin synthase catalytic subunit